jgi:hypothetical protein
VKSYDRDGQVIPDDWYAHPKTAQGHWATDSRVARTEVGEYTVSTVWLYGIDHNFRSDRPVIFETMVFGPRWDNELDRYSTEEEAMRGHLAVLDRLRAEQPPWDWCE